MKKQKSVDQISQTAPKQIMAPEVGQFVGEHQPHFAQCELISKRNWKKQQRPHQANRLRARHILSSQQPRTSLEPQTAAQRLACSTNSLIRHGPALAQDPASSQDVSNRPECDGQNPGQPNSK
jgi:hypothetical protein